MTRAALDFGLWLVALSSVSAPQALMAQAHLDGGALVVDLALENDTARSLYVLSGLWDAGNGGVRPDPHGAYAMVQGSTLHLLWGVPALPARRLVTRRVVPFAHRIGPGEVYRWQTRLGVPVQEHSPYFPLAAPPRPAVAERLVCAVDVVWEQPGLRAVPASLPGWLRLEDAHLLAHTHRLTAGAIALAVPVGVRVDEFEGPIQAPGT